jgi:hypothetical protein
MTRNMGNLDRLLRILVALMIGWLYMTHRIGGVLAIVLGIVAVAFVATSFVGWCPAYSPFRFTTRKSA